MTDSWQRQLTVALVNSFIVLAVGLASPVPIVMLGGALLVASIAAMFSPAGAIGAVLITLPYFHYPIGTTGSVFAPSELLLGAAAAGAFGYVVFGFIVARSVTYQWFRSQVRLLAHSPVAIAVTLLTVVGGLGLFWVYDPGGQAASLREWRWTLLEPMLLVGLLLVFARRSAERSFLIACFLAGGVAAAGHALADLITGGGVVTGTIRRLDGPFPHPNALALYLLRPVVLGIALLMLYRHLRTWWILPAAIGTIALVGAFSRAAIVALALAAAILVWRENRAVRVVALTVGGVAAALLVVVAGDRMLSAFSGGSLSLRVHIWEAGLHMIRDRPVLGYGLDQFLYAYAPRYIAPEAWAERFTAHGHNFVIDFWVRLGIIGAMFAVGVLCCCIYALADRFRRGGELTPVTTAALITLVAALAQGMVDNGYFAHDLAMSGWLLAWFAFERNESRQMEGAGDLARIGSRWRGIGWLTPQRQSHQ